MNNKHSSVSFVANLLNK